MSAHSALQEMLQGQQVAAKARQPAGTSVEYESDPRQKGRTAVRITAASSAAVQHEITRCTRAAEDMGNSFAQFTNPQQQIDRSWVSLGEVVVSQAGE